MYQQPPFLSIFTSKSAKAIFFITVLLFLISALYLTKNFGGEIFNSPDETANYYFARQFKEKNNFLFSSPSGQILSTAVYPRSMLRKGADFIPVGFLGFPLFLGVMAKIISLEAIPYFVIFLNALAVVAWYNFLKNIFGRQVALLSGFLLIISPAFFYYSLRPFSPNLLFADFLIFAAYFLIRASSHSLFNFSRSSGNIETEIPLGAKIALKKHFLSFLFGLFAGLALAIRPAEAPWVGAVFLFAIIILWRHFRFVSLIFSLIGFCLPFLPVFYLQKLTYGSAMASGYHLTPLSEKGNINWLSLFLPFGFHPRAALGAAKIYLINIFWWLAGLAVIGAMLAFIKLKFIAATAVLRRKVLPWLCVTVFIFIWLALFYGPWKISDRLDAEASLGVSFARYFLPVYIFITPLAALGLLQTKRCFNGRIKTVFFSFLAVMLCFLTLRVVWWQNDESVAAIAKTLTVNKEIRVNLLPIVPPGDLILTERSDKIFFPSREVASFFRAPQEISAIKELSKNRGLWYETILSQDDLEKENKNFWSLYGLRAENGYSLGAGHNLYHLLPVVKNKF